VHLEQTERHVSTRKYMNETGNPLAILHACKVQVVDMARIMVNFLSINWFSLSYQWIHLTQGNFSSRFL